MDHSRPLLFPSPFLPSRSFSILLSASFTSLSLIPISTLSLWLCLRLSWPLTPPSLSFPHRHWFGSLRHHHHHLWALPLFAIFFHLCHSHHLIPLPHYFGDASSLVGPPRGNAGLEHAQRRHSSSKDETRGGFLLPLTNPHGWPPARVCEFSIQSLFEFLKVLRLYAIIGRISFGLICEHVFYEKTDLVALLIWK